MEVKNINLTKNKAITGFAGYFEVLRCQTSETMLKVPVKLVESSYENIKITTPEDMRAAECICAG